VNAATELRSLDPGPPQQLHADWRATDNLSTQPGGRTISPGFFPIDLSLVALGKLSVRQIAWSQNAATDFNAVAVALSRYQSEMSARLMA
jgi:hypothetical protein